MKILFSRFVLMAAAVLMSLGIISCSDDEEVKTPQAEEVLADYTVMLYGVGGGNLDEFLDYNLDQAAGYGYTEKVNFTAKVKYSASEQEKEGKEGTRLLMMTSQGMHNEKVAERDFRMDNPQNLADFILSSRERFPAKKYILILWNHGLEFSIYDQPVKDSYVTANPARALVFDDNVEEDGDDAAISIFELEEALKLTGEKLDLLYWDVCTMNMIEHVYQLRNHVDYILGSEHVTPDCGGNYTALMHSLDTNSELLPAMQKYVEQAVRTWKNIYDDCVSYDLTLMDVGYVEEVVQCVKLCADELIKIRDSYEPGSQEDLYYHYLLGTSEEKATWFHSPGGVIYFPYNVDEYPAMVVDLFYLFRGMGEGLVDGTLSAYSTKLALALQQFLPVTESVATPDWVDRISLGIYFDEGQYFNQEIDGYDVNTVSKLYKMLDFEKVVGWSRFIEKNTYRKIKETYDEDLGYSYEEIFEENVN